MGDVPRHWKCVDIVLVYKKGDRDDPVNYRPVSLITIEYKILEKKKDSEKNIKAS